MTDNGTQLRSIVVVDFTEGGKPENPEKNLRSMHRRDQLYTTTPQMSSKFENQHGAIPSYNPVSPVLMPNIIQYLVNKNYYMISLICNIIYALSLALKEDNDLIPKSKEKHLEPNICLHLYQRVNVRAVLCALVFLFSCEWTVVHCIVRTTICMWTLLYHIIWKCRNWNRILTSGRCEVEDDLDYCVIIVYELLRAALKAVNL